MEFFNPYYESIAIALVIILSYTFNYISKKTNIPSVLLLIGLGVGINKGFDSLDIDIDTYLMEALELFGVVGLIMIVLEGALDLELKREKRIPLLKAFLTALFSLGFTAVAIGLIFNYYLFDDLFTAILYAIPLSILSSAIIIPSVSNLLDNKKEFLIYESTFSDILGIMFFYFMIDGATATNSVEIFTHVSGSILLTIIISLIASYALVLLLQHLKSGVKLFFLIALLIFLYAGGKLLHLSSLLIILVFGLVLNNYKLFFIGKLKGLVQDHTLKELTEDFHVVTKETAFVVRTFFFVTFGMTLNFSGITELPSLYMSGAILVTTYSIRFIILKLFGGKSILPQLWIAPRGLITVLLFFSIPAQFLDPSFNPSILLIVILASSFIMSGGLMAQKEDFEENDSLEFNDWESLDEKIEENLKTPEKID